MTGSYLSANASASCCHSTSRCCRSAFSWIFWMIESFPSKSIMSSVASVWSTICGLKNPSWKNCSASSFCAMDAYSLAFCAETSMSKTGFRSPSGCPFAP